MTQARVRILGALLAGLTIGMITAAAPPIVHAETGPLVVIDEGRLTVHASATPLATLLRLIASRSGVGLAAVGDLDAPVTVDLDGVELGEAIGRVARPHATVWIMGRAQRGSGDSRAPAAAERNAGAAAAENEARSAGDAPDARLRQRAMVFGPLGTPPSAAALQTVLADPDVSVRVQAAYALRQSEGVTAIPMLAYVAATDPDARVRVAAVRALSFLPGADAARALALASRDPDASVRREAARGLGAITSP